MTVIDDRPATRRVEVDLEQIDHETVGAFKAMVDRPLREVGCNPLSLEICLRGVAAIDTAGVAVLIRARSKLVPWGGELRLTGLAAEVRAAIDLLGLGERLGLEPRPGAG